jgi:hypothetical protein
MRLKCAGVRDVNREDLKYQADASGPRKPQRPLSRVQVSLGHPGSCPDAMHLAPEIWASLKPGLSCVPPGSGSELTSASVLVHFMLL